MTRTVIRDRHPGVSRSAFLREGPSEPGLLKSTAFSDQFGSNLANYREFEGITIEEAERRANIARATFMRVKQQNGDRLPRIDFLVRLDGALHTMPAALLAGLNWTPAEYRGGHYEIDRFAGDNL
jgi:hypothetical protein